MPATTEYFNKQKTGKLGLRADCKNCKKEKNKEWREANKGYNKQYCKKNKERVKEQVRDRYKRWYKKTKNKEKVKSYYTQWCEENKKIIRLKKKEYVRKRRNNDIGYRILCNCRTRLCHAVKGKNKSASTMELIGCSIEQLLEHLESQFQDGMTWDNYGEWHIDHIKPCAMFDFTKEEDQRECFHYTNLQPLWAEDNLRKSDKYIEEDEQLSIAI